MAARLSAPERRAQLLDATKTIVDADGFHAVSIEAVARTAGITRPIVYHHFPDGIMQLLMALVERETARALEQLAALLSEEPDLLGSFEAYLDAVAADPETWRVVLMPPEGMPSALHDRIRTARAGFAQALAGAGGIGTPDPEVTGAMLQALADEGARLLLDGRFERERLVAHARWLIGALRAEP